jgi:hypothetical protein
MRLHNGVNTALLGGRAGVPHLRVAIARCSGDKTGGVTDANVLHTARMASEVCAGNGTVAIALVEHISSLGARGESDG